ncbi:hypothetical protein L3Q82_001042 [Scortum barcoo]|uniref:Uncharacterized protein n=1 Tax=Scortum barcoo TaxID=214431 RepID=A0ACB8WB76_9TELE|nr:hypothetical protein L3Q82_001042 [Scortum barcoo]
MWKITKEKVHVVVRDNARNMAKATSEFGVPSLPCMAHTLQLAVSGGALSQRNIADALAVGRRVVGHFKHSPLACSRFEDIQKELSMPVKKLQQDAPTRWNSTYYMMQSLMEQKRALSAYAADYELPATLNATQWGILEKMTNLLEPFEQLTKDISSAEATAADVIPAVMSLTRLLAKTDESDKDDPTQEDWNPAPKKARNKSLQDMYQEILAENDIIKQATAGDETASQVHAYLGEVTILKKECPLKYWKSNQMRFPALARVARKYLTAPCTSVDSERLFSAVSNVIDEKRNQTSTNGL